MELWKLFSGTFVLIFLAELGDKTQLAAMAKTADSPDNSSAKWIVFLAASLALTSSTFIAVFLGHILKSMVPDERYIKIAAAILFLIFGLSILYETYTSMAADRTPATSAVQNAPLPAEMLHAESSLAGNLALRAALDFETLAINRYRRLARKAAPQLASLLEELALEEESHLQRLEKLPGSELPSAIRNTARPSGVSGRHLKLEGDDAQIIAELIAHEEATADFYRTLASRSLISSVKTTLTALSSEESSHALRLRAALLDQNA